MARSAIHPGEHLAEAIGAAGGSAAQVAHDVGVSPGLITDVLHGKCAITTDMAERLGHYFGISAGFWMNLQRIYDLRTVPDETCSARGGKARDVGSGRI